jgi:hypothetical protein
VLQVRVIAFGRTQQNLEAIFLQIVEGGTPHGNKQITIKGHLDNHWSAWFDNMTISNEADGAAVLCGPLADQAALHGVLIKIRDLGLPLLAVATIVKGETQNNQ